MIKKYINKIVVVIAVGFLLSSCNKAVIDYNSDFKGYWKSGLDANALGVDVESHFIISDTHNELGLYCEPNCFNCNCTQFVEGRAQVNTDRSKIRIGQSRNTYTLTINQEPYLNSDSVWVCELNNIYFYKQ
jgi:maltoporin